MINVSPIGRNCSQDERIEFSKYDEVKKIRETMIQAYKKQFPEANLSYSIGGQISIDVFPKGWDKTYCLQHLKGRIFKKYIFLEIEFYQEEMIMRFMNQR